MRDAFVCQLSLVPEKQTRCYSLLENNVSFRQIKPIGILPYEVLQPPVFPDDF